MHESLIKHAAETDKSHVYACIACKLYDSFYVKFESTENQEYIYLFLRMNVIIQNKKGPL